MLPRIHAFEFEDQSWFPKLLRSYITDYLSFCEHFLHLYEPAIPKLSRVLSTRKPSRVVDLCSGSGATAVLLQKALKEMDPQNIPRITLSDYFPDKSSFAYIQHSNPGIDFDDRSIDARSIPKDLHGFRTLFTSFHHFPPNDARLILENAISDSTGIAIFEFTERSPMNCLRYLAIPLLAMVSAIRIRPYRFSRLFFSFVIPILPLVILWDGLVSNMRTYSPDELQELVRATKGHDSFSWEIGKIGGGIFCAPITYLIGIPNRA